MCCSRRVFLFVLLCFIGCGYFAFQQHYSSKNSALETKKAASCIFESKSIADVLPYATESGVIMLFDIDNTLASPAGDVGTDQWVMYTIQKNCEAGMDTAQALQEALKIYFRAHDYLALIPTEKDTINVLNQLKENNVATAVLTTRSFPIVERTVQQLDEAGIMLNAPKEFCQECLFAVGDKQALFKKSIIFCNNNDKGKTLMSLCEKFNYHPQCVVFVDDKLNNLLAVQKECLAQNIRFIGIRYGYLDERVRNFDSERAERELQQLLAEHGNGIPAV